VENMERGRALTLKGKLIQSHTHDTHKRTHKMQKARHRYTHTRAHTHAQTQMHITKHRYTHKHTRAHTHAQTQMHITRHRYTHAHTLTSFSRSASRCFEENMERGRAEAITPHLLSTSSHRRTNVGPTAPPSTRSSYFQVCLWVV
jgi:Tfp pilus assembly protein PilV